MSKSCPNCGNTDIRAINNESAFAFADIQNDDSTLQVGVRVIVYCRECNHKWKELYTFLRDEPIHSRY